MKKLSLLVMGTMVIVGLALYGCDNSNQPQDAGTDTTAAQPATQPAAEDHTGHAHATDVEGEPMVGKWGRVSNPGSTIEISEREGQLIYKGAWGEAPCVKKDDFNMSGSMSGIELNINLNPDTDVLAVQLVGMGEVYEYKRVN